MSARRVFWLTGLPLALLVLVACGDAEEDLDEIQSSSTTVTPTVAQTASPSVSPTETPSGGSPAWEEYVDPSLGFSLPHPPGLNVNERSIDLPQKGSIPATQQRAVSFVGQNGVPVAGVSITPNPAGLELKEWIRTVPGWPCDPMGQPTCTPDHLTIAGETAIRFSLNVLGEPAATIYFAHAGSVYALGGNVFGTAAFPPALSEAEFQRIIDGFRFSE